jgi:hypothetical protein
MDRKQRQSLRDLPDPLKPKDIQGFLGLSKNSTYNLIEEKQFHSVTVGKLKIIPKPSFVRWYLGA